MKQRTEEWFRARLGKVTASRIVDVMAKGQGVTRKKYMIELLVERLTGKHTESYINEAMQWGIDEEPMAVAEYEIQTGNLVTPVGFIDHPDIKMAGASPDGFVGDNGLIEVKSPNTSTHVDFLLSGKIDRKYIFQMMWQMDSTKREWCDFSSYDSRMPPKHQLLIKRVESDPGMIADIKHEVQVFLTELDAMEAKLK